MQGTHSPPLRNSNRNHNNPSTNCVERFGRYRGVLKLPRLAETEFSILRNLKNSVRMGYLRLTLACLCVCIAVCLGDDYRDKRQTPFYFHNQQQPRGQVQRPPGGPPQSSTPQFPRFSGPPPQGFRPSPALVDESREEEEDEDQSEEVERNVVQFSRPVASPTPSATPLPFRPTPSGPVAQQQQVVLKTRPLGPDFGPTQGPQRRIPLQAQSKPGRFPQQNELTAEEEAELAEEQKEEEPDRLTELLPQSKFSCSGKKTGYYADDGLNCEVFHYCQDNARHSWVCPEGFLFHQVHLICMPPSSENICQQSSQFHFVNDFLYKAINEEEHERKPNVSLRYADRYYPESYYHEEDQIEEEPQEVRRPPPQVQPRPVTLRPGPQQFRQFAASNQNQVFHSPEEVNIPLQNRRPTTPPAQQVQVQNSYRFQ
ncbi:hypothetical protein M8J75_000323 [Diaphorina citri]|nr:hypothetical protein M8J75_000323 [Diaphorina citri]